MDNLRRQVSNAVSDIQIDFGGGCSLSKGYVMAWLIRKYKIMNSIDIGVYRGRSLVPQAVAHREFTGGQAYGVDPWSNVDARETGNPDLRQAIDSFIDATDFPALYSQVCTVIRTLSLEENCKLIRQRSCEAVKLFERENIKFGLIHIDGNHDTERVMSDISLYLPRLIGGGFIVLDDISWDSVRSAYATVSTHYYKVYQRIDAFNDYAVFWDAPSRLAASILHARLTLLGRG
jgi:hypothetical protein